MRPSTGEFLRNASRNMSCMSLTAVPGMTSHHIKQIWISLMIN